MELVKGSQVLVTVDPTFRTRGDANTVWVDYPNILRVVPVGGRIYIDDGLISLVVTKIGADAPPAPAARRAGRALPRAPASARYTRPAPAGVLTRPVQEPPAPRLPGSPWLGAGLAGRRFFRRSPPVPVQCGARAQGRRANRMGRGS